MIVAPKTKSLTFIGVLAGLYFVITTLLAPLSFGPLQFRFADILQPFVLKGKKYIYAIALGTFLANMQSPFGVLDWGLMPVVSIIAGNLAYYVSKQYIHKFTPYVSMLLFACVIAIGVGFVLYIGAGLPYIIGFAEVFITVGIANMIGVPLIDKLVDALKKRNLQV